MVDCNQLDAGQHRIHVVDALFSYMYVVSLCSPVSRLQSTVRFVYFPGGLSDQVIIHVHYIHTHRINQMAGLFLLRSSNHTVLTGVVSALLAGLYCLAIYPTLSSGEINWHADGQPCIGLGLKFFYCNWESSTLFYIKMLHEKETQPQKDNANH